MNEYKNGSQVPAWDDKKWHNKHLIALTLFLFIFITLGLCFSSWWFWYNDEFINLALGKTTTTWQQLLHFFYNGDVHQPTTGTFSGHYRPFHCIFAALEYWCFGTNAWYVHLTNVFVHGINSVLIFYMAQSFSSIIPALCGALFFAFHPLVAYEFGRFDCLHLYLSTTYILVCCMLLKRYLDTKNKKTYALLCITFALSLINRETTAVLPFLFTIGAYLYSKKLYSFKTIWAILISFVCLRFYLLPVHHSSTHSLPSLQKIIETITLWIKFLLQANYDFFGLSWLPEGHPIARCTILFTCAAISLYCFTKSRHKLWLVFAKFCSIALLWPTFILGGYCMRYNYEAQPFMILCLIGCWMGLNKNIMDPHASPRLRRAVAGLPSGPRMTKKLITIIAWALVCFNIIFCIWCFAEREQHFIEVKQGFEQFCKDPRLTRNKLCFVRTPGRPFGNAIDNALTVFLNIPSERIYNDESSRIHAPYFINKGFVRVPYFFPRDTKIKDSPLNIPQVVLDQKPLFITWDFEKSAFKIMENNKTWIPGSSQGLAPG